MWLLMNPTLIIASWIVASLAETPAWAHATGAATEPLGWTFPPFVILPLAISAALYAIGTFKMWRNGERRHALLPAIYFTTGWLSLLIALDSPIHELGEHLFWVHMTQHEI